MHHQIPSLSTRLASLKTPERAKCVDIVDADLGVIGKHIKPGGGKGVYQAKSYSAGVNFDVICQ